MRRKMIAVRSTKFTSSTRSLANRGRTTPKLQVCTREAATNTDPVSIVTGRSLS
jgi:hypothetical protein